MFLRTHLTYTCILYGTQIAHNLAASLGWTLPEHRVDHVQLSSSEVKNEHYKTSTPTPCLMLSLTYLRRLNPLTTSQKYGI